MPYTAEVKQIALWAAKQCYASYWDIAFFTEKFSTDNVTAFTLAYDDGLDFDITFPGSETLTDWMRDAASVREIIDPHLGPVADGFFIGMPDMFEMIYPKIPPHAYVCIQGHSLGAARALIFAALLIAKGFPVERLTVITFGSPRPGGSQLAKILEPVEILSFRNGNDPVTEVPTKYMGGQHPRGLIPITSEPIALSPWDLVKWHHMQAYIVSLMLWSAGEVCNIM